MLTSKDGRRSTRLMRPTVASMQPLATAALVLALVGAPGRASAATLSVIGGAGVDGTALCPSGDFFCGGQSDDLTLGSGTNPVSGSFTYNSTLNQLSFSLTLNEDVTFSGNGVSETFQSGTTFTASNISVSAPTGSSGTVSASNVAGGAAETLFYVTSASSTKQELVNSALLISALSCQTVGPSQQCGVILGTGGSNEVPVGAIGSQAYGGLLGFNVNVDVVPLPAAAWLLVSGLGGLVVLRRAAKPRA